MKYLLILLTLFSFNTFAEPVNINKANAKTIAESLKGIGNKRAQAIVRYRAKHGSFKTLDDLRNVKGIGDKIIKNIASDVGLSKGKGKKSTTTKKAKAKKQDKKKTKSTKAGKKGKKKAKSDKATKKKKSKTKKAKKTKSK